MKLTIFLSSLFMIECARAKSSRGFYLKKCAFASSSDIPIRRLTSSRDIGTKTRSTNGRAFIRLKGAVNVVSEAFATTIITAVDESLILSDSTLWALRAFSAIGSYVGFVSYFDRPRGTLNVQEGVQVEIKESMVPGAGLGLFAKTNLQRGTLLGTYPGVVIPLQQNLDKLRQYPACEGYTWRFSDNKSGT